MGADNRSTVVLLHGVGLDHALWGRQVAALAPHMHVITYDLLCHGACPKPDHPVGLTHFVDQLGDELDRAGLARASIVGFSFGGMIAQAFAASYPERVNKLVIMGAVYRRAAAQLAAIRERFEIARRDGAGAMRDGALERWYTPRFRRAHPDRIATISARLDNNVPGDFLAAYQVFLSSDDLVAGRLKRITAPTLVIAGEDDPGSTPAMAESMAAEIPDSTVLIIKGARHMLPDQWADDINTALLGFLTSSGDTP